MAAWCDTFPGDTIYVISGPTCNVAWVGVNGPSPAYYLYDDGGTLIGLGDNRDDGGCSFGVIPPGIDCGDGGELLSATCPLEPLESGASD
jgi:hypothetical protein